MEAVFICVGLGFCGFWIGFGIESGLSRIAKVMEKK